MRAPEGRRSCSKLLSPVGSDGVDGPHGSSCDDSITPRARQSGWTVTGGTGMIGRRGTPEGSVLRY